MDRSRVPMLAGRKQSLPHVYGWPMLVAAAVRIFLIRFNRSASVIIPRE
jgi:hypothetical protein